MNPCVRLIMTFNSELFQQNVEIFEKIKKNLNNLNISQHSFSNYEVSQPNSSFLKNVFGQHLSTIVNKSQQKLLKSPNISISLNPVVALSDYQTDELTLNPCHRVLFVTSSYC